MNIARTKGYIEIDLDGAIVVKKDSCNEIAITVFETDDTITILPEEVDSLIEALKIIKDKEV